MSNTTGKSDYYNSSACADPTAYKAIENVNKETTELEKRVNAVISILKSIIGLAGFELISRIEIKDKKTGREFR